MKAASVQVDYAKHDLRQEQAKEGAQLYAGIDAGHYKQIVTSDLTRTYNAATPSVGISYGLLGTRSKQLEAIQTARTEVEVNSITLEDTQRGVLHDLRKAYALVWQYHRQSRIADTYLEALTSRSAAADKLRQRGLWTDSDYLQFKSTVAAAQADVQRFHALERTYVGAMRAILGSAFVDFTPLDPEMPKLCPAIANLDQSARQNSALLKKFAAELEALAYDKSINAGSSVDSNVHAGLNGVDEVSTGRRGYSGIVGVSIAMPANFREADQANMDKLNAATIANRALDDQARQDLRAQIEEALENYHVAMGQIAISEERVKAAREALREVKRQFDLVPRPMFDELVKLSTLEYAASLQETEDRGTAFVRVADLLLLAPDSCSVSTAEAGHLQAAANTQ